MAHAIAQGTPALILGATSDIAVELAHLLAQDHHPLILAARNPDQLEATKVDLEIRHQVDVTLVEFDALNLAGARAFYDKLDPKPHIVVCMVGHMGVQSEQETDPEKARLVTDSNFTGPAVYIEAAAATLSQISGPTKIVGVSSVAGDRGRARNYYYGAAKAGFTTFLSGLRQRLIESDVSIITIKPGFVETRMTEGLDLPTPLVASSAECARLIKRSIDKNRSVVYPWKWWLIMRVIRAVPEFLFVRTKF